MIIRAVKGICWSRDHCDWKWRWKQQFCAKTYAPRWHYCISRCFNYPDQSVYLSIIATSSADFRCGTITGHMASEESIGSDGSSANEQISECLWLCSNPTSTERSGSVLSDQNASRINYSVHSTRPYLLFFLRFDSSHKHACNLAPLPSKDSICCFCSSQ